MALFQLLLLSVVGIFSHSAMEEDTNLLLVQTLFRHGDRAPVYLYPKDPNSVDSWPNGLGELTQLGKKEHYELGKYLRQRYKGFATSDPNEIYVNSSAENRCLNSVESNLASFWAPEEKWKIEEDLNWQPIPIHYLPPKLDIYLNVASPCPRSDQATFDGMKADNIKEFYQTHQTMVEDITNHSGLDYSDPSLATLLFDTLIAERIHNLIIPEWALYYWDDMRVLHDIIFQAMYNMPEQLPLRMGSFLGLVTENLKNKMNGNTPDLKFILNSSHDFQVAGILLALNFTDMPRPPYCATLIFELHEMADNSMAVRLLYMNSTNSFDIGQEPHVLVLNDCTEFCPVEFFMESYQWMIPNHLEEDCKLDTSDE